MNSHVLANIPQNDIASTATSISRSLIGKVKRNLIPKTNLMLKRNLIPKRNLVLKTNLMLKRNLLKRNLLKMKRNQLKRYSQFTYRMMWFLFVFSSLWYVYAVDKRNQIVKVVVILTHNKEGGRISQFVKEGGR